MKQGTILNCTPHTINVHANGDVVIMLASGRVPRVSTTREVLGEIDGIPIDKVTYGKVTGLPEEEEGVYRVVSMLVAQALPQRLDLLVVGEPIRDSSGVIVGCKGLSRP